MLYFTVLSGFRNVDCLETKFGVILVIVSVHRNTDSIVSAGLSSCVCFFRYFDRSMLRCMAAYESLFTHV